MPVNLQKKFRFREFKVYQDARVFIAELKRDVIAQFPRIGASNLISQISRALNSITLNIAEGSERSSDKDFARYLNQSHGSLNEVVGCLDMAMDSGYITSTMLDKYLLKAGALGNQLTAFRDKLLKDSNQSKVKRQMSIVNS